MYVMIPSSVAWFVLGFISGIICFILLGIYLSRKQKKNNEKLVDKYLKTLSNKNNKDDK